VHVNVGSGLRLGGILNEGGHGACIGVCKIDDEEFNRVLASHSGGESVKSKLQ